MNSQRKMIAISTGDGFTILLAAITDFGLGDQVEWDNDTALGKGIYRNLTKRTSIGVDVQNHWVPSNQLREKMLIE